MPAGSSHALIDRGYQLLGRHIGGTRQHLGAGLPHAVTRGPRHQLLESEKQLDIPELQADARR